MTQPTDAQMLDWLERQKGCEIISYEALNEAGKNKQRYAIRGFSLGRPTLRSAIRAAMTGKTGAAR